MYDQDACRLTTRVNLIVPAFAHIPGIGAWQLDSRGRTTYQIVKGLHETVRAMRLQNATGAPVTIRLEIARGHNPKDGSPSAFPIFRIDSKLSIVETVERAKAFAATVDLKQLPAPDDSTPPLGAGLTTEQETLSATVPIYDVRKAPERPANALDDAMASAETLAATLNGAAGATEGSDKPDIKISAHRPSAEASPNTTTAGDRAATDTPLAASTGDSAAAPQSTVNRPSNALTATTDSAAQDGSAAPSSKPLTADERSDFKRLIGEAARAEGLTGATPGQDWLERHFGTRSLDAVVPRIDELIERANRAIAEAQAAVAQPQDKTTTSAADSDRSTIDNAAAPPVPPITRLPAGEFRALVHKAALMGRVKGKTPGKSWLHKHYGVTSPDALTDSQYEEAVRKARAVLEGVRSADTDSGSARSAANAVAALVQIFTRLQFIDEKRAEVIRAHTDGRVEHAEDMTDVEIRSLIDELGDDEGAPSGGSAPPVPPAA